MARTNESQYVNFEISQRISIHFRISSDGLRKSTFYREAEVFK
jgi:hypothetical protein